MTMLPWVLVTVLALIVVWLLLALAGASRTIATLRTSPGGPADPSAPTRHLSGGLPAGVAAPSLGAIDDEVRGLRRLIVFVDPDCAACADLVPALQQAARDRRVPTSILVDRGQPGQRPQPWRTTVERVRWVDERGSSISDAYEVDVTPTAFLVDEGGLIVAGGPTATVEDVFALVDELDGVRIAPGTSRAEHPEVDRGTA